MSRARTRQAGRQRPRRRGWVVAALFPWLVSPLGCRSGPGCQTARDHAPLTRGPACAAVPPCGGGPMDLGAALALAGAANPTIALAQEAVRTAQAERLQADAALLPTLHAGADI